MLILDLETSCTSQVLSNYLGVMNKIMTLISIIVPILLIISLVIKFTKAVASPEEKKLVNKIRNSVIAVAIVIFIPVIVDTTMHIMGEKYNLSSCWLLAKEHKISLNSTEYKDPYGNTRRPIIVDPDKYEDPDPMPSSGGTKPTVISGGVTKELGERLVQVGRTQIGLPYYSMHYGPKEGDGQGFGCAMFVSYCYNQVFFGGASGAGMGQGFYGSTYEFWGNVSKDGYNAYNKTFKEVSPENAQAGDVVAFLRGGNHYSSYSNCYHVGLYAGNGKLIDSMPSTGVSERTINIHSSELHFLRYMG